MRSGDLIGQLLQAGLSRGAGSRMQAASHSQPGLGGLLGGLLGGGGGAGGLGSLLGGGSSGSFGGMTGGGRAGSSGGLGGLAEAAGSFLGQGSSHRSVSPAMGGGIGGLVGSMLGGGRASGALGGAAMGVIGMIAMNALQNMGRSGAAAPSAPSAVPTQPVETPEDVPVPTEDTQRLLLMAMVSAAKADGHVDDTEMTNIVGKLKETGADPEERDWILRELTKPLDLDALVAAVPNLDVAAQVYTASVLAITADTPQEIAYLDQLAAKLGLQPTVLSYIHQALGLPLPGKQ